MITGGDPAMLSQCLDLCQALASKGQKFTLNLTHTGTSFTFSLDTRGTATTKVVLKKKKKASPSTLRRNLKRKEEFLKRKSSEPETETIIDLESSSQVETRFKCNLCEKVFNTEPGMKIHKGKAHKGSDPPAIEQLRDTTEVSSLKGTPAKEAPREEQCVCCGEVMSPLHQCIEEPSTTKFCLKCGKGFETQEKLYIHRAKEDHVYWTCDFCGMDFEDYDDSCEHDSNNDCV